MVHGRTPFQNITNEALKLNAIANPNYQIAFPDSADFHVTDVLKVLKSWKTVQYE